MVLEETVLRSSRTMLFFPGCLLYSCAGGWMARIGSLHSDYPRPRLCNAGDGWRAGAGRVGERV